ncbi:HipA family kinase [Bacillus sp. JJ1521]|uniref:HipA family kinase n=1 Tax=Bacillus sp. JJ1521 TaxID=3122957 RepID=UPI0030002788
MTHYIKPIHSLYKMPKGHSSPHLIRFDDGNDYVVKFKNNPTGTRTLVNEYVAGKLAKLLKLPVIPFRTVYISQEFIDRNQCLSSNFSSGTQYASLFLEDTVYLPKNVELDEKIKIINYEQLAGVIAFDYWLGNVDRNRKNLLLKRINQSDYQFYIIDHGHCFNKARWTVDTFKELPIMSSSWRKAHKIYMLFLQKDEGIFTYIKRINELPLISIQGIVHSIPEDWEVSENEKEALIDYLVVSRERLQDFEFFQNWMDSVKE